MGDFMNSIVLLFAFSLIGFLLFLFFFNQELLFGKIHRKRSGKDRRKNYDGSKNLMRRCTKDRRQFKKEEIKTGEKQIIRL